MEATRRSNRGFKIALDTLRKKFPTANFNIFTDFDRYSRRFVSTQRVKGQFDNGSYIILNISNDGSYRIAKKYDAGLAAMKSDQVMEFFTNQNK